MWKVFHHGPDIKETLDQMTAFAPFVDGFLIDAKVKGMRAVLAQLYMGSGTCIQSACKTTGENMHHCRRNNTRNTARACL
ncbi:hypothetical protein ACEQPO_17425 [Bacillus sp. SL00103]